MTAYKDMNTRRLKRAYLRAAKRVWYWEQVVASVDSSRTPYSDRSALDVAISNRDYAKKLLKERGWSA